MYIAYKLHNGFKDLANNRGQSNQATVRNTLYYYYGYLLVYRSHISPNPSTIGRTPVSNDFENKNRQRNSYVTIYSELAASCFLPILKPVVGLSQLCF